MAFKRVPQKFTATVNEVTIGTGDKAITLGGENVLPLYSFDAPIANKARVGIQITDSGYDKTVPGIAAYFAGCETMAEIAKKASEMPGADFVSLSLEGADPNGADKSVDECVAIAKEVAEAIDCPLAIQGSKNVEKDAVLFEKIADALQGKNVLLLSCKQENYKTVSAAAAIATDSAIITIARA